MRCPHCPAPEGELCRGEKIKRFCQLVDSTHPDYNPAYKRILVKDDVEVTDEMRAEWMAQAMIADPGLIERMAKGGGCCG
jgi:hypothetical protein